METRAFNANPSIAVLSRETPTTNVALPVTMQEACQLSGFDEYQ
jgi:hypothetical protein